jgi:transcriptional regulator with XRE-family HTH domain
METTTKPAHIGRKITRIRELRGIKQEQIAMELGVSQQTISRMEASEVVDDELLGKVAKVLGITKDAILQFSEEGVINYFNTFNDNSFNNGAYNAFNCNFNPVDKLMQALEENKTLYERLLKSEQEKVELLKGKA